MPFWHAHKAKLSSKEALICMQFLVQLCRKMLANQNYLRACVKPPFH